ncbi:MAG: TRAP transporter large permease subunit [Shewanella sp.]|nr:TRAP transporter large permease subunit [Shewanella sp.]MCF1431473.1 TRAP transporter large permease subunit [Shewanella sp.]MCF1437830.1 TRAP transporter large permease subunit [Shewanella sp.]MCF1459171.1 TRAP transporter large permease subunit [Shewanella sp.]
MAFTLAGVALMFAGIGMLLGEFNPVLHKALPSRLYCVLNNPILMAVPLFLFMGTVLEKSRVSRRLIRTCWMNTAPVM